MVEKEKGPQLAPRPFVTLKIVRSLISLSTIYQNLFNALRLALPGKE